MTVRPGAEPFARDGDDAGKRPGASGDPADRIPSHALHSLLRGYRTVAADLPAAARPVPAHRPNEDHVVPASSSAPLLDRVRTPRATGVILREGAHVAPTDQTDQTDQDRPAMAGGRR